MRRLLLMTLLLSAGAASAQQSEEPVCAFQLSGSPARPRVSGPENIVKRLYIAHQPDSPIQILGVDLKGMELKFGEASFEWSHQRGGKIRIRNRSDQPIQHIELFVGVLSARMGQSTPRINALDRAALKPGEEKEVDIAPGRGKGPPIAAEELVIVVGVDWVRTRTCRLRPAMILPARFGLVHPF